MESGRESFVKHLSSTLIITFCALNSAHSQEPHAGIEPTVSSSAATPLEVRTGPGVPGCNAGLIRDLNEMMVGGLRTPAFVPSGLNEFCSSSPGRAKIIAGQTSQNETAAVAKGNGGIIGKPPARLESGQDPRKPIGPPVDGGISGSPPGAMPAGIVSISVLGCVLNVEFGQQAIVVDNGHAQITYLLSPMDSGGFYISGVMTPAGPVDVHRNQCVLEAP